MVCKGLGAIFHRKIRGLLRPGAISPRKIRGLLRLGAISLKIHGLLRLGAIFPCKIRGLLRLGVIFPRKMRGLLPLRKIYGLRRPGAIFPRRIRVLLRIGTVFLGLAAFFCKVRASLKPRPLLLRRPPKCFYLFSVPIMYLHVVSCLVTHAIHCTRLGSYRPHTLATLQKTRKTNYDLEQIEEYMHAIQ